MNYVEWRLFAVTRMEEIKGNKQNDQSQMHRHREAGGLSKN
jgi:hypothetical protein